MSGLPLIADLYAPHLDAMGQNRSLDDLVGAHQYSSWQFNAERFCRLRVHAETEMGWLFHWQLTCTRHHVISCRDAPGHENPLRKNRNPQTRTRLSLVYCPVPHAKIIRLSCRANHWHFFARLALHEEGRIAIVTNVERGMRWMRLAQQTNVQTADGEAVWSRRPDAGVKFCGDDPQGDGGKKARFTRESAEETVKTIRAGNAGMLSANLW